MVMKKLILLLLLVYPMLSFAQHDDIYFVPKKEKKVVASVTKTENIVLLEDEDEWCDEETYYTDDYGYENDDFRYSTRIVRFRSPRSIVSSSLYWDLRYNCGIDDWIVYDDGYYLDIYPTYSNSLYYYSRPSYNWWVWDHWYYYGYNRRYNYWGYNYLYPSYHWAWNHHLPGWHISGIAHNSTRPGHKVHRNVPLRGNARVAAGNRNVNSGVRKENGVVKSNRPGTNTPTRRNVQMPNRVSKPTVNNKANAVKRKNESRPSVAPRYHQQRVVGNINDRPKYVRPQQTNRPASGAIDKNENSKSYNVREKVNKERQSKSPSKSSSRDSYRSSSSSSKEYTRPSSTSVSRQRGSSSNGQSSVGSFRNSGSSRGSSGSARAGLRR